MKLLEQMLTLTTPNVVLTCAAITTALIVGLLYAYSCSVNPGLHRLSDSAYLAAMQSINRAILNPVFFLSFIGTAILLPICTWLHYNQMVSLRFVLLLVATVVYLLGVMGVTLLGNVPLNEALNSFDLQMASPEELAAQRAAFEIPWNSWHTIRTIASIGTLVLVVMACIGPKTE